MDELSTYVHSTDKSWNKLLASTETGIDWMPIGYFAIIWSIDQVFGINQTTLRLPNIFFLVFGFVIVYKILSEIFGHLPSFVGIMTVFSHSLLFPFILVEARPYCFYLLSASILLWAIFRVLRSTPKKFSWLLYFSNILCPFVFYIGGVYCAATVFAYLIFAKVNNIKSKCIIYSSLTGWITYSILFLPTFYLQMRETRTNIDSNSINIHELFALYGNFIYFPVSLLLIFGLITLNHQRKTKLSSLSKHDNEINNHKEISLILFISVHWIFIPIILFIVGKITYSNFLQSRYFTPNLIAYSVLISFFSWLFFKHYKINKFLLNSYILACICLLFLNSYSLGKAFSHKTVKNELEFLKTYETTPVMTLNMFIAFHITKYHSNEVIFVVGDEFHANYMSKFSSKYKVLSLFSKQSSPFNIKNIHREDKIILIPGNIPFDTENFINRFGYKIVSKTKLDCIEANYAFYLVRG